MAASGEERDRRFKKTLKVSPIPPRCKDWCLLRDFRYDIRSEGSGDTVEVERGFVTDFASIPRLLWFVLPRWGKYGEAAVVHDYLYWEQKLSGEEISRKRADQVMLEAMEVLGVPPWQRRWIYRAVRMFGRRAWEWNRLNKNSGHQRVIEPERLTPGFRYERPTFGEEERKAETKPEKSESSSQRPALSRFSERIAKVVAPGVLERALDGRRYEEADDDVLADHLRAGSFSDALTELEESRRAHERALESLDGKLKRVHRDILAKKKLLKDGPGEPPERRQGEADADYQLRLEEWKRPYEEAPSEITLNGKEVGRLERKIAEEVETFKGVLKRCREKIQKERDRAIVEALEGLTGATRDAFKDDRSVGFTLALASDAVYAMLESRIEQGGEKAAVLFQKIEELIDDRQDWSEIKSDFGSTAKLLGDDYRQNRDLLRSIENELETLPQEEVAKHLDEIFGLGKNPDASKAWFLLKRTNELASVVKKARKHIQSKHLQAMQDVLEGVETAGRSEILRAWALLGRGRVKGRLGDNARTLCVDISDDIARKLGVEDGAVIRAATGRLLVDQAQMILEDHTAMRFLASRGVLERYAAEQFDRERRMLRRAVFWVVAPVVWLSLRKPMKTLRRFFGAGATADPPQVYRELRLSARKRMLWGGWVYGLLAIASVALLFLGWPPQWPPQWPPSLGYGVLLGIIGANFLIGCVYLLVQWHSIRRPRLPGALPPRPTTD